ncbi:MAG: hypothetical protein ABSA86_04135 [Oryzomonas sp.]|jgi:hypothetical protein
MGKFIGVVSALFLATFVVAVAFFSAPVWALLIPLRFAVSKVDDASEASSVPQQGFRYLVPAVIYACIAACTVLLYTAVPGFASLLNGIGISIGLLPASYF